MKIVNKYFSFFFIPVLASLVPFLACHFFDSPLSHGFFSAEGFFLLLVLSLPCRKFLWKLPFITAIFAYAFYNASLVGTAIACVYLLMFGIASIVPRKKKFLLPTFALLSLFIFVADSGVFFYSTFVLNISDIWGLAKFFWWGPILFLAVPVVQISLELLFVNNVLWGAKRVTLSHKAVFIMICSSLLFDWGINLIQQRQPIMDFPIQKWIWQLLSPGTVGQNPYLQEDIKAKYPQWHTDSLEVLDYSRPTVVVLVESYGVNKSVTYTDLLLAPFKDSDTVFLGLLSRRAGHTQGAEWEDFWTPSGIIQNTPLPQRFKNNGLQTWYMHGYNGDFYERGANYAKFGFDSLLFLPELSERGLAKCNYSFPGICDSAAMLFIDSLLTDSIPKFIYWTTLDAHPPYELARNIEKSSVCQIQNFSDLSCTYFTLQQNTLLRLASLARRHPECRFVIRGDHRPMGSMVDVDFVQSFYFKWVPMIVLNR